MRQPWVRASIALAVVLLVPTARPVHPASESPIVDRAREVAESAETRIERLEARSQPSRSRPRSAKEATDREAERLEQRLEAAIVSLRGLPWTEVEPLVRRLQGLYDRASSIREDPGPDDLRAAVARSHDVGTASIAGTVVDDLGAPVARRVELYSLDHGYWASTTSDAAGAFVFANLPRGQYTASTYGNDQFLDEVWNDIPCDAYGCDVGSGTPITVTDGEAVTGIDFALARKGRVSGRITDAESGAGLASVYVQIADPMWWWNASIPSDADGNFVFDNVPPGTYAVWTSSSAYLDEVWDDVPCEDPNCNAPYVGDPIQVSAAGVVTGIDFALVRGASIAGTASTTGVFGYATVELFADDGTWIDNSYSNTFHFAGLAAGTYFLRAYANGHRTELWDDLPCDADCVPTNGTPIVLAEGQSVSGLAIELDPLPRISGTVTDEGTGLPLGGAWVDAVTGDGSYAGSDTTDEAGGYEITVPVGEAFLVARRNGTHLGELYAETPCWSDCDPLTGTAVAVAIGDQVHGIDFTLSRGGWIALTVVTDAGTAAADAPIALHDATGAWIASAWANVEGRLWFQGLVPGDYRLVATGSSEYQPEVYPDAPCAGACDPLSGGIVPVTVSNGTAVVMSISKRGRISGTIASADGEPLSLQIELLDADGDVVSQTPLYWGGGPYSFSGIPAGTYFVRTHHAGKHVDEIWSDVPCEPDCAVSVGTPIVLASGEHRAGIDFTLELGGWIEGTVSERNEWGTFYPHFVVHVFDAAGVERGKVEGFWSLSQGKWLIGGLSTGLHYVLLEPDPPHSPRLWERVPCPAGCDPKTGDPILVTAGQGIFGIDFVLAPEIFANGFESGATSAWTRTVGAVP